MIIDQGVVDAIEAQQKQKSKRVVVAAEQAVAAAITLIHSQHQVAMTAVERSCSCHSSSSTALFLPIYRNPDSTPDLTQARAAKGPLL